ncbi:MULTISPECIES: type II toxin-antitoxin system VapC family toxin [unclassified Rhizobium]|uniref:type II toxin-antitoxin system VapC family toxin n=1 Tax=unclassified Rhizobium TaxID=2613769 RepID=UPI0006F5B648|nr:MULTISPECIES: type II toxin-antitoxin system VapC family toxin [unclassified Rhizobium]KQV42713.1 DNA-binding protein [Rhizobium sp. Root1212]KRD36447.1 DNA-binding protein [Rhizobium sp. Root268]
MKITVDTNVLVRAVVHDDPAQAGLAGDLLRQASMIAVPLPCLCEFVWVLRRVYGFSTTDIVTAIRALLDTDNVVVNRPAAEAGLWLLEAGGDFADGIIAYEGDWLGGEIFVSFDKQAVKLLKEQGRAAQLLAS